MNYDLRAKSSCNRATQFIIRRKCLYGIFTTTLNIFHKERRIWIKSEVTVLFSTSTLRLLALRGLRTRSVRRVALWAPGVTQSSIFWNFYFYINIVDKGRRVNSLMDPKIYYSKSTPLKTPCQPLEASL